MRRFILILVILPLLLFSSCNHNRNPNATAADSTIIASKPSELPDAAIERSSGFTDASGKATAEPARTPAFKDTAVISGDGSTITVHNANELVYYLESGKHILLMPGGNYDVHDIDKSLSSKYSNGLRDLENVVVEGIGGRQVDFITESYEDEVLQLVKCRNITLKNLNFGHGASAADYCPDAVLILQESENVTVENCTMFGSGSIGIFGKDISYLKCGDCVVKDCSLNVMELWNIKNAVFESCSFENGEDEAIYLYNYQDIVMKDCRLSGGKAVYPRLIDGNGNGSIDLLDVPNDGEEHVIAEQTLPGIKLLNVNIIGITEYKELVEKLQAIRKGVGASLEIGREEVSGSKSLKCELTYASMPEESDYLPHIYAAKELIAKYFKGETVIYVSLNWPGAEKNRTVYSAYNGAIWLWDNYKNIGNVMKDKKNYITVSEAETALKAWFPPLVAVKGLRSPNNNAAAESIDVELYNTTVYNGSAYYIFNVYSNINGNKKLIDAFNVNALDGSISKSFDGFEYVPLKHAETKEIEAVLNYLASNDTNIPEDGTLRAFKAEDGFLILLADFTRSTFALAEKDGILTVEPYYEFEGD